MGRTKTVSDDAVLDATSRVLLRRGPHDLTLADVAREAGIHASTILQRHGTKRALIVAFARRSAERAAAAFPLAEGAGAVATRGRSRGASGVRRIPALRASLLALTRGMRTRTGLANSLALLVEDVRDEELRMHARVHADRTEDALTAHLGAAARRGEIAAPASPRALARLLQAAFNGAIVQWALRGTGTLDAWVGKVIDTFVETVSPPVRGARKTKGKARAKAKAKAKARAKAKKR